MEILIWFNFDGDLQISDSFSFWYSPQNGNSAWRKYCIFGRKIYFTQLFISRGRIVQGETVKVQGRDSRM